MSAAATGVFAGHSTNLGRWVQLGIASGNVINVAFSAERPEGVAGDHPLLEQILAYLDDGQQADLSTVAIALTVPTEHRHVYETVRAIPFGTERTVADVVARTATLASGEEGAGIVRTALAANPIPLLIPEHRVAEIDGSTDAEIRRRLRDLEGFG